MGWLNTLKHKARKCPGGKKKKLSTDSLNLCLRHFPEEDQVVLHFRSKMFEIKEHSLDLWLEIQILGQH